MCCQMRAQNIILYSEINLHLLSPDMTLLSTIRCLESFLSTAKRDCIYRKDYDIIDEVKQDLFEYIELFYNRKHMHETLGHLTSVEWRQGSSSIYIRKNSTTLELYIGSNWHYKYPLGTRTGAAFYIKTKYRGKDSEHTGIYYSQYLVYIAEENSEKAVANMHKTSYYKINEHWYLITDRN